MSKDENAKNDQIIEILNLFLKNSKKSNNKNEIESTML
jgi:hypothetical protein